MKQRSSRRVVMRFLVAFIFFTLTYLISMSVAGQAAEPGSFRPGQKVEVEYIPDSSKWLRGTVVEVLNDGYMYKVKVAPWGDGKVTQSTIHYKRVRAVTAASTRKPERGQSENKRSSRLAVGKYACTSSRYNSATGSYEYDPKGSFTLSADGVYRYNGFGKPSSGRYSFDARSGKVTFKGGYFDRGEATPIEGRANRFYLVFPTIPDNRWTCGLVDKK